VSDPSRSLITPEPIKGELRIRDVDLAARLEFAAPIDIRKLVRRYADDLARMGVLATVAKTSGQSGGRPATEFYLNRKQAIFITAKSETAEATDITIEIIERFDAYERGAATPTLPTSATDLKLRTVREARLIFGRAAARRMWEHIGLPSFPEMFGQQSQQSDPAQAGLFDVPPYPHLSRRPTKLTPDLLARVEARVAAGETKTAAFRAEGVCSSAFRVSQHRQRRRAETQH
jgi:hypothetical protein